MPLKPTAFIFWITSRHSEGLGSRNGCTSPDHTTMRLPSTISECSSHDTFLGWPFGLVAAANALRSSGMTDALPTVPDTPPTCAFADQVRRSRLSAYQ